LDAMHGRRATEEDSASDLTRPVPCGWEVVAVRPCPGFQLGVEFADGTRGQFDLGELDLAPDAMFDTLKASAPNTIVKL